MNNEILKFEYEGKQIRTAGTSDEPFFVAKDVCDILGLSNSREATSSLDIDELVSVKLTSGGQVRDMQAVTEPGLYELIFKSRKPEAKKFKRWVKHDVIPSIRKTGQYNIANMSRGDLARIIIEQEEENKELADTNQSLAEFAKLTGPSGEYGDVSKHNGKAKTKLRRSCYYAPPKGGSDEAAHKTHILQLTLFGKDVIAIG
jgi:prophage antirepressor-like protein